MTAPSPRSAKDIMVANLVTLTPETDVFQGIDRLLENRVTGAPVIDSSGRYLGMFSEQCCMAALTEAARVSDVHSIRAKHLMSTGLLTFDPDTDACDAIKQLIHHRVSGAPVVDAAGCYLGSFSEKTSMRMLVDAIYEQRPVGSVAAHMDRSSERLIDEDTDFNSLVEIFLKTVLRRLPVIQDGILIGQVSRRDVLRATLALTDAQPTREKAMLYLSALLTKEEAPI
jgi:CBS domain-containing protein